MQAPWAEAHSSQILARFEKDGTWDFALKDVGWLACGLWPPVAENEKLLM